MNKRKGRPPSNDKKEENLIVRIDKRTVEKLKNCVEKLSSTKSEIVRMGIDLVDLEIGLNINTRISTCIDCTEPDNNKTRHNNPAKD